MDNRNRIWTGFLYAVGFWLFSGVLTSIGMAIFILLMLIGAVGAIGSM